KEGPRWTIDTTDLAAASYFVAAADQKFRFDILPPPDPNALQVAMQFSPIPFDGVPIAKSFPDSRPTLHRMIDDLIDHGMNQLVCPLPLPADLTMDVESYAQSRGMTIMFWFERGIETFKRDKPPKVSIYS